MSTFLARWLLAGLILGSAGCGGSALELPNYSPASIAEGILKAYDKDNNGRLDEQEVEACPALKRSFASIDRNKSKSLERDELEQRVQETLASKTAFQNVSCRVTREGQALPGAQVTFVPEVFYSGTPKGGAGVSDNTGAVAVAGEGAPYPGFLAPGFYRVEVSLKNAAGQETIPAKYNTNTVLGAEIGPHLRGVLEFDIR